MLEYASMRFRLSYQRATRFPSVIVSTERIARTLVHSNPGNIAHIPGPYALPAVSRNVTFRKRISIANPADFDATERNAVIVMGAPSYTSGVQKWNGTAEIL